MSDYTDYIDENKLTAAKEKLACHIQPPGSHASGGNSCTEADPGQDDFIDADGNVFLTRMTTAGG